MSSLAFSQPIQGRAKHTVDLIVAALERLLSKRAFEDITIADIVGAAGVSTGSFYARFASKEAVLPYAYARYSAAAEADLKKKYDAVPWERQPLVRRVQTMLSLILENFNSKRALMRAMTLYARTHPRALPDQAVFRSEQIYDSTAAALAPSALGAADEMRLRFATFVLNTLAREHTLFGDAPLTHGLGLTKAQFEAETVKLVSEYLAAGASAGPAGVKKKPARP